MRYTVRMSNPALLPYVHAKLAEYQASGRNLKALSREAGVRYSWLRMVAGGHIPNPGVIGVQKLADRFARDESTQ